MQIISNSEVKRVPLVDVKPGDCFLYQDHLYIRVSTKSPFGEGVSLSSGIRLQYDHTIMVQPVREAKVEFTL